MKTTLWEFCGGKETADTVILYSVIPIEDTRFSDLKLDLAQLVKGERYGGTVKSYNDRNGLYIETEIVEFKDGKRLEMVTSIQFTQRKLNPGGS